MERRPLTATQLSIVCNSLEVSEIEARQILLSHDNDFNSWKTSWVQDVKRRTRAQTPAAASPEAGPLPPNWREVHDPRSGRTYWYHTRTKQTTWVRPRAVADAPSAAAVATAAAPAPAPQMPHAWLCALAKLAEAPLATAVEAPEPEPEPEAAAGAPP